MSDLVICRICLLAGVKSYHYARYNLKYCYEQITSCKVSETDQLPQWFCFECATLLHKYYKFKQKCFKGQSVLSEIAWNGILSHEAVNKVDRKSNNLDSSLSITHTDDQTTKAYHCHTVPYKKRNKTEHNASYIALDPLNTPRQDDDIDTLESISETMNNPSTSDHLIKSESITVDLDMLNQTVPRPIPEPHQLYATNYAEPVNYHQGHSVFGHPVTQEQEPVWLSEVHESSTSMEEKKQWCPTNSEEKKQWCPTNSEEKKQWCPPESEEKKQWCPTDSGEKKQWSNSVSKSSFLDPVNWKRTMLTEDQAVEKFHKRAVDPRYLNARYKCTECFSNFARDEILRKHILINHVESVGSHVCRFCKRRFHKACKLRLHMKRHYVQIECLRCNMLFWGEGLAFQHEEFHRGVLTTCKYCSHQFRHKSTYYQHLRTHHRSSHVCDLCGASFVSKAGLSVHKKRLHTLENKEARKEPDTNIYCKRCDMKFATLAAYQEHYSHSALHADGMDVPGNEDLRAPSIPARPSYVRCTVCNEQFFSAQACMKHHRHHHPAIPFMRKSLSCGGKSNERVNCELCGALIKVTSLYTHMNAHTRTKVYTCEVCEMTFNYPTSLLRHKVTHTGEKKYPCPLCEKRFTQRNSMQLHYRTFHLKEPYPKRNRQKKKPQPPPENITLILTS